MATQKITPFLWFDHQTEEAATSICVDFSELGYSQVVRYGNAGPGPVGDQP